MITVLFSDGPMRDLYIRQRADKDQKRIFPWCTKVTFTGVYTRTERWSHMLATFLNFRARETTLWPPAKSLPLYFLSVWVVMSVTNYTLSLYRMFRVGTIRVNVKTVVRMYHVKTQLQQWCLHGIKTRVFNVGELHFIE
jgi:hypothetical protein